VSAPIDRVRPAERARLRAIRDAYQRGIESFDDAIDYLDETLTIADALAWDLGQVVVQAESLLGVLRAGGMIE
jgi:hypothetical protein